MLLQESTISLLWLSRSLELLTIDKLQRGMDRFILRLCLERNVFDRYQVDLHWVQLLAVEFTEHGLVAPDMQIKVVQRQAFQLVEASSKLNGSVRIKHARNVEVDGINELFFKRLAIRFI